MTVNAEAESATAGITSVQISLPEGIAPADITQVSAPDGWTFTTDAATYTVAGPALAVGADSTHQVRIRQLPTDPVIYFKVLQTYSDGRVDRWIDLPTPGVAELQMPAPPSRSPAASPAHRRHPPPTSRRRNRPHPPASPRPRRWPHPSVTAVTDF